jgi:outer membrane receptor protein involved in Fe transport
VDATYLQNTGVYPAGKASFKFAQSETNYPFAELNTVAKMPTLVDRFGDYGVFFHGNSALKPERVYAVLFGYKAEVNHFESTTTLKGEYRNSIQIPTPSQTSIRNGGDAYLMSLKEDIKYPVLKWLEGQGNLLLTNSRLMDSGFTYPDLPYLTAIFGLFVHYHKQMGLAFHSRFVGNSTASGGGVHPAYALLDTEISYAFEPDLVLKVGVDNFTDATAQAVLDYPLPGRRYFASLSAVF